MKVAGWAPETLREAGQHGRPGQARSGQVTNARHAPGTCPRGCWSHGLVSAGVIWRDALVLFQKGSGPLIRHNLQPGPGVKDAGGGRRAQQGQCALF